MIRRAGMSMLEVLVAFSLLAIVVASLGALSVQVAHKSFSISGSSYIDAELTRQMNRLQTLPFDSLATEAGTTSVAATPYAYSRSVTITDVTSMNKQIRLIVAPANTLFRADTVTFNRTKPASSVLNSP